MAQGVLVPVRLVFSPTVITLSCDFALKYMTIRLKMMLLITK